MRSIIAAGMVSIGLLVGASVWATAQDSRERVAAADGDDLQSRQAAERFLAVLEKAPRRGTALDRLYGYHVEGGTLETFVRQFTDRTARNVKDGTAWMILGLLESQRGRDAAAVAAFAQAEKTLPGNPLASYYLGQSLVLVGQPDEAAAAFERGIARKPPRADLLEMFQSLGRVYQRGQKGDQALAVWNRLEKLFPDDLRVQEQIAITLVEEGQHAQALPRFESLAERVKDEYRAAAYRVEAADLKVRIGQTRGALADFELLLARLNPDNWLYRDVRRRIDEVFLRTDDQAGLAAYYEAWVSQHPDDVESMGRLARILTGLGRTPEAQSWLDKALKLAPSRKDLRLAFIEQLLTEKQYGKAIAQYELLARNDPQNPDILREWGRLILKDTGRPEADRQQAAAAVWRKLVAARPQDSLTATQVADLFRQSEMPERALELYRKAVELSPDVAQYREYLGEYLQTLQRSDEALATWREIAAGKKRTPENLARLAEVLAGFGYLKEATTHILAAGELDRDEFKYPLKAAELLSRAEDYGAALEQLDAAAKLADSPESSELVLQQRIRNLQLADRLESQAAVLRQELAAGKSPAPAERWYLLSRYLEAARSLPDAEQAIGQALKLDEKSIVYRGASARIAESSGNLQGAADAYRGLAGVDRRFRTEHLKNVARLEVQLGRSDQALQAGRDLLAAAPGNAENYEFFAQLCFQLGKTEEGLESLRRSVRLNPNEARGMLTLAAALADQFRTDEAIALYWRAFEKSGEMEGKLAVVQKLTDLYLQTNHFDRMVERFERGRREASQERELTICLAQAHQSAGDYGTARQELERLLLQNTRDTQLLRQLSNLAESEGDTAASIKYQRQLNALAPAKDGELRLAQFLTRVGDNEEAAAIWARMAESEADPAVVLNPLDSLLAHDKHELALLIIERLLQTQPQNWELLYRAGSALGKTRPQEAKRHFRAILALTLPDDEPGMHARARSQTSGTQQQAVTRRGNQRNRLAPVFRDPAQRVWQIRQATQLEERDRYNRWGGQYFGWGGGWYYGGSSSSRGQNWSPGDFGEARMAALGWLYRIAIALGEKDQFLEALQPAGDKADPDSRALWDWYYLQLVLQDKHESYAALRRLSQTGDTTGQWLFLSALPQRPQTGRIAADSGTGDDDDEKPPLSAAELEHVLTCYRSLAQRYPGQLSGGSTRSLGIISNVLAELKRAGRPDDEETLYRGIVTAAKTREARGLALQLAASRGEFDTTVALFDALASQSAGETPGAAPAWGDDDVAGALLQMMSRRGDASAHGDVLLLLDKCVAAIARTGPLAGNQRRARGGHGQESHVTIWRGGQQQGDSFDYPLVNPYFDREALSILRQAYHVFEESDLLSDLTGHCRKQADGAPLPERLLWRLGLAYLNWWSGDKEQAIVELTRAAEQAPADQALRLELADLQDRSEQYAAALATADSVVPSNHAQLQQREQLALRLAVRTGQADRARRAGERLFGLRLDAETQVALVADLRQLGMHDLAEGVLGRARRQAGNRTAVLLALMNRHQTDQKPEQAQEVAYQILRLSSPATNSAGPREADQSRQQALAVLARSSRIADMIARVEAQLKASPESVRLFQSLAEYHLAAGDKNQYLESLRRMAALRPDDMSLLFQVAQQIESSGKAADALEMYGTIAVKDPLLFSRSQQQICNAFQRAHKLDVLARIVEQIDLRRIDPQRSVFTALHFLFQDEKQRDAARRIFRRLWEALPDQRERLATFDDEAVRLTPAVYELARDAAIPRRATTLENPWSGLDQIQQHRRGEPYGTLVRLVDLALLQNRLLELRDDAQRALEKHPDWLGGKALLAVIHARSLRPEQAVPLVESLLADSAHRLPAALASLLGRELENHGASRQIACRLYEDLFDRNDSSSFDWEIFQRLTAMYKKQGEPEKARDLVFKTFRARRPGSRRGASAAEDRMQVSLRSGHALVQCGFPLDAVRAFREVFDDEALLQRVARENEGQQLQSYQKVFAQALKNLGKADARQAIAALLEAAPPADPARPSRALNLLVETAGRDLERRDLVSLLERSLRQLAVTAELRAYVRTRATELAGERPDDFSACIVACLAAGLDDPADGLGAAVSRLAALVERTPLELLPAGTRANARQRLLAARQIGLWLVARECLKRPDLRPAGQVLATRALEAARRQSDHEFTIPMLREWGQILFEQSDPAGAAARWTEMLETALGPPAGSSRALAAAAGATDPPAAVPLRQRTAGGERALSPVTMSQFTTAVEIARLAGKRGLTALSLRAVHDALVAGPPVQEENQNQWGLGRPRMGSHRRLRRQDESSMGEVFRHVEAALIPLAALWSQGRVPVQDQYDVLAAAVFPTGRPAEIFLYPRRLGTDDDSDSDIWQNRSGRLVGVSRGTQADKTRPRSVAQRLAAAAVQSHRTDDLRRRIADRRDQPLAKLPALVLIAQLALESGEPGPARAALEELQQHLAGDALLNSAELSCHVALPALERDGLSEIARALLELAVGRMSATPQSDGELCSELLVRLARRHLERGELEPARETFRKLVEFGAQASRQNHYGRWQMSADDSQWKRVAQEYLRAGNLTGALDALEHQIGAAQPGGAAEAVAPDVLSAIARLARELPAAERYDLLKAWTFPEGDRRQVRLLAAFTTDDPLPEAFRGLSDSLQSARAREAGRAVPARPPADEPRGNCLSTAGLLIEAARQADRLEDLLAALRERATENVRNAGGLLLAARIASGDAAGVLPDIRKFVADQAARFPEPADDAEGEDADPSGSGDDSADEEHDRSVSWADYLVVRGCLSQAGLRDLGEQALKLWIARAKSNAEGITPLDLSQNLAALVAARGLAGAPPLPRDANLALWRASNGSSPSRLDDGSAAPPWVAREGHLVRLPAADADVLHFKYPLTGDFEFSVDVLMSREDGGGLSFGGTLLAAQSDHEFSELDFGSGQPRRRASSAEVPQHEFSRLTVRSNARGHQFFINDHLTSEQIPPAITSPFLSLSALYWQRAVFRNLKLRGDLRIPREAALTFGDQLEGWSPDRYGESRQERKRLSPSADEDPDDPENGLDGAWTDDRDESEEYQWWARDGVIFAREPDVAAAGPAAQSLLAYERPLEQGDSLRYEFFYEPGKTEVHPALGQLAFLLDPAGVRLHWLTATEGNTDPGQLPADNAVDEPHCRRGPQPLPLKVRDWNRIGLTISGDVLVLELNGIEIYRRPLEPANSRQFGLFRDPSRTGVQVRSVVLSGDWPERLSPDQLGNLLVRRGAPPSVAENKTVVELIEDHVLALSWDQARQQARALPTAERFELLRAWVLPGSDRTTFRLAGGHTPTLPPPGGTPADINRAASPGIRRIAGGEIVAPALDLIEAARELMKFGELERMTREAPATTDQERRGQLALLALVAAARDDLKSAAALLAQLAAFAAKIPRDAPEAERWPELLAASAALRKPDLAQPALNLLDRLIAEAQGRKTPTAWDRRVFSLRHRVEALSQPQSEGPPLRQWAPVSHATARSLNRGAPAPQWLIRRGEARHVAGLAHDLLYCQSPLRGDFELTCRLTAARLHDMQVGYAGSWVGLSPARDKFEVGRFGGEPVQKLIEPKLADPGDAYDYRLAVHDGVRTISINGVRIHEEPIGAGCDPWLVLHTDGASSGKVHDLRISGTPTIPDSLELLAQADLTGWLADYYHPVAHNDAWHKDGDLLTCKRRKELPGTHRQNLIRYHRPLLEDGEIEYEFYYEPGKVHVHPAVDRLTFMLEPAGVRIHWLTDPPYDRTTLAHDNVIDEPANRRGPETLPLKERDWNRIKLALKGDLVSLSLNDVPICERALEATNQRCFGLFHYSDESEVRVRRITYHGNWPRTLPALIEQELAGGK